jgi:uncharacterized protein YjbI with pentapeptide repeats
MANPEHLAKLKEGVETWNGWRRRWQEKNPSYIHEIDLSQANLRETQLVGVDLSRADLSRATLSGAHLSNAYFRWADLSQADLSEAILNGANLHGARVSNAQLISASLLWVNLSGVNLTEANLSMASLYQADLRGANLTNANLTGANLDSASLQRACLDHATLTDARLWETQRAGWSIQKVICERIYWNESDSEVTEYAPGEFERLYSDRTRIELIYPGGMTTFELNTLPALLHHLTTRYPNSGIRLKSIEEAGGGAKISISVENGDPAELEEIQTEANRSQTAQIALRDDEITRLKIQKQLLLDEVFPRMLAAAPQIHFADRATNVAIAVGNSTVEAYQTHNDTKALLALLKQINGHRAELALARPQQIQLEETLHSVQHELSKPEPKSSLVASGLKIIKETVTKALESAAEKAITDHWHLWLIQLTSVMHHFRS